MDMYISIATKMLIGSVGIFLVMRIIGKKAISEITPYDILYVIILGALIEESLYDDQVNIFHVLFALSLWALTIYAVEKIVERTEKISALLQGSPAVLIDKGRLNINELRNNHLDMEQLRVLLRQNGCYAISDAYFVILEVGGGVTVVTKDEMVIPSYLLIEHGHIKDKVLKELQKDEKWLRSELARMGESNLDRILYCEWNANDEKLYFETTEDVINRRIAIDD